MLKLIVIMRPSESGVVPEDGCMASFDVECEQYTEQKTNFIALRLNLLRQFMEHYLTFNSRDDILGSKYRDFMIK